MHGNIADLELVPAVNCTVTETHQIVARATCSAASGTEIGLTRSSTSTHTAYRRRVNTAVTISLPDAKIARGFEVYVQDASPRTTLQLLHHYHGIPAQSRNVQLPILGSNLQSNFDAVRTFYWK